MVPPWRPLPPTSKPEQAHALLRKQLQDWAKGKAQFRLFPKRGIEFDPDRDVIGERSRINVFTAYLTAAQADAIARRFKYFVSPSKTYEPSQTSDIVKGDSPTTGATATSWAALAVVPTAITPPSIERTPVLYVVDTGVSFFKDNTSTLHAEFSAGSNNGNLKIRQGRCAPQIGLWPVSGSGVWNAASDSVLGSTWVNGSLTGIPAGFVDPQRDPIGHGTKVASAAIGATTGITGRISGMKVEMESIRIYSSETTFTAAAINGISQAMDAHLLRNAEGNAPSVLVFASRTTAGFDPSLEVALWWAWSKGMICVAAGGNKSAAYATGLYSPDSLWYPFPKSAEPTSPSRFDWTAAASSPSLWPAWDDAPEASNPYPNAPYLVLVGAMQRRRVQLRRNRDHGGHPPYLSLSRLSQVPVSGLTSTSSPPASVFRVPTPDPLPLLTRCWTLAPA